MLEIGNLDAALLAGCLGGRATRMSGYRGVRQFAHHKARTRVRRLNQKCLRKRSGCARGAPCLL
jgi:hypothetical protein